MKAHAILSLLLLPLLLLPGCGKDGTGPAPAATRLEISPASLSLGIGESAQLEARILDQNGHLVGGQASSITWSSSDTSVIGIDNSGLARGLRLGTATVTARSGALQGSAQAEVLGPRVQRQEDAAARSTIGPEGGSLSATAASGTRYTLSIPAGALQEEREITVTPLSSIERFPGGAEVVAGVHFGPEGLVLHRAATLEIELPAGRPAAGLLGFAYAGDGEDLHLTPSQADGQTLRLRVTHFSGVGAVAPPTPWEPPAPGSPEAQAKQALALLLAQAAPDLPAPEDLASILRTWYTDGVRPALAAAGSSAGAEYATYLAAVREHGSWDDVLLILGVVLEAEQAEARQLHVPMLRTAIEYANQRCEAEQALLRAAQALWLQERAEILELATPENALDRATILQTLCLNAVFEHLMLMQEIEPGQSSQLSLLAGYGFGASATRFDRPFEVQVELTTETTSESFSGMTNAVGEYRATVFWPEGTVRLMIHVTICLSSPEYPSLHAVCNERRLIEGANGIVRVTGRCSWMGVGSGVTFIDVDSDGNRFEGARHEDQQERARPVDRDCSQTPVDLDPFLHTLTANSSVTYDGIMGTASASATYSANIGGILAEEPPSPPDPHFSVLSLIVNGTGTTNATLGPFSGGVDNLRGAAALGFIENSVTRIEFSVAGGAVRYLFDIETDAGPNVNAELYRTTGNVGHVLNYRSLRQADQVRLEGILEPGEYLFYVGWSAASRVCRGFMQGCVALPPLADGRSFVAAFELQPWP